MQQRATTSEAALTTARRTGDRETMGMGNAGEEGLADGRKGGGCGGKGNRDGDGD